MSMYRCFLLLLGVSLTACRPPPETPPAAVEYRQLLTLDTHIDIPVNLGLADADPRIDGVMQVDIPKMRRGGLDAGFFIVYVQQGPVSAQGYADAYVQAQQKFDAIERMLANSPTQLKLVRSPDELAAAVAGAKLAVAIGVENAYPLGPNLEHLDEFYQRGARYISLTHFGHNDFGDSSVAIGAQNEVPEPVNGGLSDKGRNLIERMNDLGMMVDVSHTGPQTTLQAAAYSSAPVIASHSGVYNLQPHPRNLSDAEIRAIAASGGVIQLVAFDSYMRDIGDAEKLAQQEIMQQLGLVGEAWFNTATQTQLAEVRARIQALNSQWPRASVATLVDNIDYVVALVGIDHAGIASDFGGGGGVQAWDTAAETDAVTEELIRRGYRHVDIQKIWAGNLLRVWREVEARAAQP